MWGENPQREISCFLLGTVPALLLWWFCCYDGVDDQVQALVGDLVKFQRCYSPSLLEQWVVVPLQHLDYFLPLHHSNRLLPPLHVVSLLHNSRAFPLAFS